MARAVRGMLSDMGSHPPRHTKMRQRTISGGEPREVFSLSRPSKPPAKAIHARKAAALRTGGKRLPAGIRKRLEREGLPRRTKMRVSRNVRVTATRAGKRTPRRAKKPNPGT
ncbi:MAG: hypothetical protein KGN00_00395 [Chloroflexota bacterium]|nr:hypothetical protein [Chloroflexota bacterium]MDE3192120.1 hypothetical protein [Chloroflexota bacterium]